MSNPYHAPQSEVGTSKVNGEKVDKVRSGQKLLITVIALHILAIGTLIVAPSLGLPSSVGGVLMLVVLLTELGCLVGAFIGLYKIGNGLDLSAGILVLMFVAMFVPLINLLTLLHMNGRATKFLQQSGYRVGLLGAT